MFNETALIEILRPFVYGFVRGDWDKNVCEVRITMDQWKNAKNVVQVYDDNMFKDVKNEST